jgi:predicted dehydrogenase
MLRLAMVGLGWAGTRQVQAIGELGRKLRVECLVDPDAAHLRHAAAELKVDRTYPTLDDALADGAVDAVSICAPHAQHGPLALQAIAAGKHVLCEKPLALTVEDATRMIEAAEAHGVTLFVAENFVYQPMTRFLRHVVQSGEYVGELTAASLVYGFRAPNFGYPGRRAWLTHPDVGGTGTWMLHGIHTMAQLRAIFGEVDTIYLREHHATSFRRPDIEGTLSGVLTMCSGLNITLVQSCETRPPFDRRGYVLHGDRGSLHANDAGFVAYPSDVDDPRVPERVAYAAEALSDYAQEMEAFADHVAGVPGPTDARSERRTLAVVQAGYEAARDRHPVSPRQRFGELE